MKTSHFAIAVLFVVAVASSAVAKENPDPPPLLLNVTITSDNAYGFGFGSLDGMDSYYGGVRNMAAGEISGDAPGAVLPSDIPIDGYLPHVGAEIYNLSLNPIAQSGYIYIVAWDDGDYSEGLLAGFQFGDGPLLSGNPAWSVFATGIVKDSATENLTAADRPDINDQIQIANHGTGGLHTSVGWVDANGNLPNGSSANRGELAIGSKNDTIGALCPAEWPTQAITSGISSDARWMWYDYNNSSNPFRSASGNVSTSADVGYLIFRIPMSEIGRTDSPEPSSLVLLGGMGSLGLAAYAWRRRK
jgi:hypothetical protein